MSEIYSSQWNMLIMLMGMYNLHNKSCRTYRWLWNFAKTQCGLIICNFEFSFWFSFSFFWIITLSNLKVALNKSVIKWMIKVWYRAAFHSNLWLKKTFPSFPRTKQNKLARLPSDEQGRRLDTRTRQLLCLHLLPLLCTLPCPIPPPRYTLLHWGTLYWVQEHYIAA